MSLSACCCHHDLFRIRVIFVLAEAIDQIYLPYKNQGSDTIKIGFLENIIILCLTFEYLAFVFGLFPFIQGCLKFKGFYSNFQQS